MAARTEVVLGGSPHDPRARCAGSSVPGYTHPSQHLGHLRGFGCVPGFRPASLPTAMTRDRGRLSLIVMVCPLG
jgi:hypothetical protein